MNIDKYSNIFQSVVGFGVLILLAFCFSENKKAISWRLILTAFVSQNLIFILIHNVPLISSMVQYFSQGLIGLLDYAKQGTSFVLGDFANSQKFGFVFLLVVVPTLIFFGSLIGILYFFGIIQVIIGALAYCLRKNLKLSGVESLIVIADIFLGQSEGPLVISHYIPTMTRSELACAFIAGLANISGSTLAIYLSFLGGGDPKQSVLFANYLITASFMNAFSAICFAKILFPETNFDNISSEKVKISAHFGNNFLDSVFQGAITGLKVGVNIVTILIAVIALVNMIDGVLAGLGDLLHLNQYISSSSSGVFKTLSLEYVLGQIFRILAFFMGISWSETLNVGSLLGQKVALNEFIAYMSLSKMKLNHVLSENAVFISTFALSSFSNFSSIGISLGVFSVLAPSKNKELTQIAWKALFGAVLAGFMTATIAGFWHNLLN